tara:strand:+ start:2267 stop:3367 length:1101 start_codon:yes stop_codon:yes gene_type:complete
MIYYLAHSDWILFNSRKEIANRLKELNYQVSAITTNEKYADELKIYFDNFYEWKVNKFSLIDINGVRNLRKKLKKLNEGDFLHIFTLKSGLYALFSMHFLTKKFKIVLSVTGLGYLFSKGAKSMVIRNILRFYMKFFFNKKIDYIIFQNHKDQKILSNYLNFKNESSLIRGSGLDLQNFVIKKNQIKEVSTPIKIMMCCRLLKDKGIDEYFKLSSMVNDETFKFYLAGDVDLGNPSSYSKNEIKKLTEIYNIEYLDWIDAPKELKNFDISICMSYHEGLPRIVLESLFIGLYTISNNLPGLRPIFDSKENGKLISENNLEEFKQSIIDYPKIDNLNEKIIYSRNKMKNNFSTEKILNEFVNVYEKL